MRWRGLRVLGYISGIGTKGGRVGLIFSNLDMKTHTLVL